MEYKGIIKGSRTLDVNLLSGAIDAGFLVFLSYSPEQLGLTIPIYAGIRALITIALFYLRFKTTGAVGEKP